jgi:hypothetical protein
LGDATNRYSLATDKHRSNSNVMTKLTHNPKNASYGVVDKENACTTKNGRGAIINKAVISKNNNIFLIQINKFRLLFKIYEKIKKVSQEAKTLL